MPVTVTAIETVPLLEDDPEARVSYRVAVSAESHDYRLFFTVLELRSPAAPEWTDIPTCPLAGR